MWQNLDIISSFICRLCVIFAFFCSIHSRNCSVQIVDSAQGYSTVGWSWAGVESYLSLFGLKCKSSSSINNIHHSFSKAGNSSLDLEELDFPGPLLSGIIETEFVHCFFNCCFLS